MYVLTKIYYIIFPKKIKSLHITNACFIWNTMKDAVYDWFLYRSSYAKNQKYKKLKILFSILHNFQSLKGLCFTQEYRAHSFEM